MLSYIFFSMENFSLGCDKEKISKKKKKDERYLLIKMNIR